MELFKHVDKQHHENKRVVQGKVSEDAFFQKEAENFDNGTPRLVPAGVAP